MRICEVIGVVTLSRSHPSLHGATWRYVVPLSSPKQKGEPPVRGEPLIVYDELAAGDGAAIAVSEGAEASSPFYPDQKPIDAYNAAILDAYEM
jgi:ethanolamine utilization protein EutN